MSVLKWFCHLILTRTPPPKKKQKKKQGQWCLSSIQIHCLGSHTLIPTFLPSCKTVCNVHFRKCYQLPNHILPNLFHSWKTSIFHEHFQVWKKAAGSKSGLGEEGTDRSGWGNVLTTPQNENNQNTWMFYGQSGEQTALILILSIANFLWLQPTIIWYFWVFCSMEAFQNMNGFQQILNQFVVLVKRRYLGFTHWIIPQNFNSLVPTNEYLSLHQNLICTAVTVTVIMITLVT